MDAMTTQTNHSGELGNLAALFNDFAPPEVELKVNDVTLVLTRAKLEQERKFLSRISDLKLDTVAEIISGVFTTAEKSEASFLATLQEKLPEIIAGAKELLNDNIVPIARDCAVALMDTPENARKLATSGASGVEPEFYPNGAYKGCKALQAFIADQLTLEQAVGIVKAAYTLNDYKGVVGNLLAPAKNEETPGDEGLETGSQT